MKPCCTLLALVLAGASLGGSAMGQTIYKCGNSYSQQACPGGVAVDVSDTRTPAQKAEADAASTEAAKAAARMEKERVALEKSRLAQLSKSAKPSKMDKTAKSNPGDATPRPAAKQKKKEPEYFTVVIAPQKKEKKAPAKDKGEKTQVAKTDKAEKAIKTASP